MPHSRFGKLKAFEGRYFTDTQSRAGRWLNYELLKVEPGSLEARVHIREELTNPAGNLHGGMIAMIADELCGLAFYSLGHDTFYTTINLHIDFLLSVPHNSHLLIKSHVIRSGKRMANAECHMYLEDGTLCAHATTNLMNTGKNIFKLIPDS